MRKDKWPRRVGSWRATVTLGEESGAGDRNMVVLEIQGVLKTMS